MKKFLSIFLVTIIALSMLSTVCFAENPVQLKLKSESYSIYAGEEFFVRLIISDNSKMSGAAIDINYDKEKFEYVSGSYGDILDPSATKSIKNLSGGNQAKVRFAYLSQNSSIISQGILLTLRFKALDNSEGEAEFTVSIPNPGDFISADMTRLPYKVENAKVNILNLTMETETKEITETESQTEIESESDQEIESTNETQSTEIITEPESTTDIDNNSENDDVNKYIVIVTALGIVILVAVIVINQKSKSKRKK